MEESTGSKEQFSGVFTALSFEVEGSSVDERLSQVHTLATLKGARESSTFLQWKGGAGISSVRHVYRSFCGFDITGQTQLEQAGIEGRKVGLDIHWDSEFEWPR